MSYLYPIVPEKVVGKKLYPLNVLKYKLPEVYKKEIKKYKGREYVLEKKIPTLNCFWNDALHFVAVHPKKIKNELEKAGFKTPKKWRWFKIKASDINPNKAAIYLFKYNIKNPLALNNFTKYNPKQISGYDKITARTKKHYCKAYQQKQNLLKFMFIPHILLKDSFDTRKAEIIEV